MFSKEIETIFLSEFRRTPRGSGIKSGTLGWAKLNIDEIEEKS